MPQNNSISRALNTDTRFIKDSKRSSSGLDVKKEKILKRAVVVDISKDINMSGSLTLVRPAYSVAAVIIDEDFYNIRPDLQRNKKWYAPLMPITNISLPEVGEEIFIIKEINLKELNGYWVGRVNNNYQLNYYEAKKHIKDDNNKFINGRINLKEMYDEVIIKPLSSTKTQITPFHNGDVIQQGRSNTFIRHSFNPLDRSGVLEFGIKNTKSPKMDLNSIAIGGTKTKTIHLESTKLQDLTTPTGFLSNNINFYDLNMIEDPNSSGKNIIINMSNQHYNISTNSAGRPASDYLYRQVLGDKNKEIIESINDAIIDLKQIVQFFYDEYRTHVHDVEGNTFRYNKKITSKSNVIDINFKIKEKETAEINFNENILNLENMLDKFNEKVEKINESLDDSLSKTQFLQ